MAKIPLEKLEIKSTVGKTDGKNRSYCCISCGKVYKKQQGVFRAAQSPIYKGNNNYLPVCNKCLNAIFEAYKQEFNGDERKAVRRTCMKFDIYYSDNVFDASEKSNVTTDRMSSYISKINLRQYANKTYDTTIDEEENSIINSQEDVDKANENGTTITQVALDRWGNIFSADEYPEAEKHYKMLKNANQNIDDNQEVYIKDLTIMKILQTRALKNKNLDEYEKCTKLYQNTFKASKLKLGSDINVENDDNAVWGKWIAQCEEICPADLYNDQKLFEDVDGIKEYFNRFIVRPFKNFFMGTKDMDDEYSINGEIDES